MTSISHDSLLLFYAYMFTIFRLKFCCFSINEFYFCVLYGPYGVISHNINVVNRPFRNLIHGCFEVLRRFSDISAISRLGSRR